MVVMDMNAGDVVECYHFLAFAYPMLAFVLWLPTCMMLLDEMNHRDEFFHKICIKYKVLTANHIATLILLWPHVISLILQTRHGLWALAGVLLWHAWLEWARKKVSG
jgi:hypothetical protein